MKPIQTSGDGLSQFQFGIHGAFREAFHFLQGYPVFQMLSLGKEQHNQCWKADPGGNIIGWGNSWMRNIETSVFLTNSKTDLLFDLGKLLDPLEPQDPWLYNVPFSDDTQDSHKDQIKLMKGGSTLKHANCYGITAYHCYSRSIHYVLIFPTVRYLHPFSFSLLQWNFRRFCQSHLLPPNCAFFDKPSLLIFAFPTSLQGYAWPTLPLEWNPFMVSSVTASP